MLSPAFVVAIMLILWGITRFADTPSLHLPTMPEKVTNASEKELYLEPGGLYSLEDIEANGKLTATQKYAGFVPEHNTNPKPGDPVCPITQTQANPQCSWIIGGHTYLFCCPPCIDEFLAKAKNSPNQIEMPAAYVQK